ncbi:MAG: 30S ribosomal protein S9 [Deltaproteobacteria bacterium RBG_16_54_11]|jgi:small subunit ribosomal protein S9|nr:MAG: 30S ribosomal protein S9 [Deltaproteobacteria bacterium RBG_16_54_11]
MVEEKYYATGKRKTTVARVWLKPGAGTIEVNKRAFNDYFPRETLRMTIQRPFELTNTMGQFDVYVNVNGGGMSGQAGAIKHGISKALLTYNEKYREVLKKAGFITRDPRVKERKKYGQRGARARFQYSKR